MQSGTRKTILIAAVTAFIGTLLLYQPAFQALQANSAGWPGFMMTGDVRTAWFPQFVEGQHRFLNGGIFGVDFLTHDGASNFAMRPNMMPLYPPYLLTYLIFDLSNMAQAGSAFFAIYCLHTFAGIFFCVLLGRRVLGLGTGVSALFAMAYCLSFQANSYIAYTPFYFQAMLVPVVAYLLCRLMSTRSWTAPIVASPILVTYFLSNYGPTMAGGMVVVGLVVLGVFLFRHYRLIHLGRRWRVLIAPTITVLVAVLTVAAYYLGQADYMKLVAEPVNNLSAVAYSDSLNGRSLLAAFSQSALGAPVSESRLYWGLIPAAVILISLGVSIGVGADNPKPARWGVFVYSLAVYTVVVVVCLGTATVATDAFYYGVPLLGRMHLYFRYLLYAQLFFALAVAIGAGWIVTSASISARLWMFLAGMVVWIAGSIWLVADKDAGKYFIIDRTLAELFLLFVGLTMLALGRTGLTVASLSALILVPTMRPAYDLQRVYGQADSLKVGAPEEKIDYREATLEKIRKLFSGTGKVLPKVLVVSDPLEMRGSLEAGLGYLPLNQSWLQSTRDPFMNFAGYDAVLAMEREYWEMMGGYFGRFNRDWVVRTGVDFIVWDPASEWKVKQIANDSVVLGPPTSIGGGQFVSRVFYPTPPHIGQPMATLRMVQADPSGWNLAAADGWRLENGAVFKSPNGESHQFAITLKQRKGAAYQISVDIVGSTRGLVWLALGGKREAPIDASKPGTYVREVKNVDGMSDLWISGTPNFDGAITNIVVREIPQAPVVELPNLFDNGVLRLEGAPGGTVRGFSTNWTSNISATIESPDTSRLVYLLWPNRYMKPYLDGRPVQWRRLSNWPAFIDVPNGKHLFELRFEGGKTTLMMVSFLGYLLVISVLFAAWVGGKLVTKSGRAFSATIGRPRRLQRGPT